MRNLLAIVLALICGVAINQTTGLSGFLGLFVGAAFLFPVFIAVSNARRGANVVTDRIASAVIALGFIADHYGFRPAFAVSAGLMFIAVIVATKLPETRSSHLGQSSK
jgi:hypothetical protein